MKIVNSILECIGNTPLLRLNKVTKGLKANVLAKCEYLNPSGSIKDRIALRMVEEAEKEGKLKKGGTIVEFTSGNTGPALAMVAAVKGYKMRVYVPEFFYSRERDLILKMFGGANLELIKFSTPKDLLNRLPEEWREYGMMSVTKTIDDFVKANPGSVAILQIANPYNTAAHRDATGKEILEQTDNKVDAWVASIGTGGTLLGVADTLKEVNPNVKVIAVEPEDMPIWEWAKPDPAVVKLFEEYGVPKAKPIVAKLIDEGIVDEVVKVKDEDARNMANRLCQEEGLFCGMSSGANVFAAINVAKKMKKRANVVTVLVDRRDRYFSEYPKEHYII